MRPLDRLGRPLTSLRVSVTDRCNLRCDYCMPEEEYTWLPREGVLSYEEIGRLVDAFLLLGVEKLRLTGGEPTLRRDLPVLIRDLASRDGIRDLAMTTNALRLDGLAAGLREAGLGRLTVSLDTLRRDRFLALTRRDALETTLAGIAAASDAGFSPIKINTVVLRGTNEDELAEMVEFARAGGHEIRFIEYMDVAGATGWTPDAVVPRAEILERIAAAHGEPRILEARGSAPAERFRLPDGTVFGLIASTTAPFCGSCDRARLTADGRLFTCLYGRAGLDLRTPLRAGASTEELADRIDARWRARADRGAEERLGIARRDVLVPAEELREDPHSEMHTLGG